MGDMIVILEEGKFSHPICSSCDMFVTWAAMNKRHQKTALYVQGADRKRKQLTEEEAQARLAAAFQAYGQSPETVMSFKYLQLLITTRFDV